MRIDLTGQVTIEDGERVLDESALPGRQGRLVLACLALHEGPVHRDVLAESLWPDGPPATWERTLSGVVSRLRSAFAASGFEELTIANAFGCYELQRPAHARLDIELAQAEVEAAERALAVGDLASAGSTASAAVAIARRPFLSGEEADWIEAKRVDLRGLLVQALDAQAAASLGASDAVWAASEAIEAEPFRESSHVLLMRAHAALGNSAQALLAYERCRELLASELGVDPAPETQSLHVELLRADEELLRRTIIAQGLVTLPPTYTMFVGRTHALDVISELLSRERLVTLTGAGGVGKTRLAIEVARASLATFPDGVRMVDLASVTRSGPIAEHIALALGLNLGGDATAAAIAAIVETQKMLVILDNCEHLLKTCAPFVQELVNATSGPVVLATSRSPLGLIEEWLWDVPPLIVPGEQDDTIPAASTDSVVLFSTRAADVRPGFELTPANASAVTSICRRLDGLPLAIELAAARVGAMSVGEIDERLGERFEFTGGTGGLARQRTLRTTVDWSYDLLGPRAAEAFRRCAVFEGAFSFEDADAVCGGSAATEIESLAAGSLLVRGGGEDGVVRYRMLETIKQYARERVAGSEEWSASVGRHIDRFAPLVPALEASNDQAGFLKAVHAIRTDASAALDRALETGRIVDATAIAGSVWRFWLARGLFAEGRAELERTLSAARAAEVGDAIGPLVTGLMTIAFNQSDFAYTEPLLREALEIANRTGDLQERATVLANAASFAQATGRDDETEDLARQAIDVADRCGHDASAGLASLQLVSIAYRRGDIDEARSFSEQALERFTRAGFQSGVARALLGLVGVDDPPREDWRELVDRALDMARQIDDKLTEGIVLLQLGLQLAEGSQLEDAMRSLQDALKLNRRIGNRRSAINSVEQIACVTAEAGDPIIAAMLFASVPSLRAALDIAPSYYDQARLDRLQALAKSRAGAGAEGAWSEGSKMSFDGAYELAMAAGVTRALVSDRSR
jgi:predicted ATPase/DNA-binding SARP family transcriptional activator